MKNIVVSALLILFCVAALLGTITAAEKEIWVVEKPPKGSNGVHVSDSTEVADNGHTPLMVGSVSAMVDSVLGQLDTNDCISELNLLGHAAPGVMGVGDGTGYEDGKHINGGAAEWWDDLKKLKDKFCEGATVYLLGCNVGACSLGAAKLKELADSLGVEVAGAVDEVTAGENEDYKENGRWQKAHPDSAAPACSLSTDEKAKKKKADVCCVCDAADLFSDNFPSDPAYIESFVRADMAKDIGSSPWFIRLGDSMMCDFSSPMVSGIGEDPLFGGPRVYLHVLCEYVGSNDPPWGPKPPYIEGPVLQGTYGIYRPDLSLPPWSVIQGEQAVSGGMTFEDKYMFDLNDSLFTRGYRISYYFRAFNTAGDSVSFPLQEDEYAENYLEFTCLPTGASDILYVADADPVVNLDDEEVVSPRVYYNPTFEAVLPPTDQPDRYDVNGAERCLSNGLGSRAHAEQLRLAYRIIIWDCGRLDQCTICDGVTGIDKSPDIQTLIEWMDISDHQTGLWICGDNIAEELITSGSPAGMELLYRCGVEFVFGDYLQFTGSENCCCTEVYPAPSPGIFDAYPGVPFYIGRPPECNSFDMLDKTPPADYALQYWDFEGNPYYAAIQNEDVNPGGNAIYTMWFGFSFMHILDAGEMIAPLVRNEIMAQVMLWMGTPVNMDITGEEIPQVNLLVQNFPNPFNPSTMIRFSLKDRGRVSIRIYDVTGRLIETLLDEFRDAGAYEVQWTGTNNSGSPVASGIYFYQMRTGSYECTKKMVLLK
ncbi:MAG: T9SS type A sorting domain-containing protein [Candidatus Krumholzibacteriota bacterium]|nr:T9SS type A sorting domain-containing protein [Candidatus Krumholzibacteriota bacterium]